MPENEEDGIVVKTLQNNKKLLTAVSIAILIQLYIACANPYTDSIDPACSVIALLLVFGSFVFNLNKKSKSAIACTAASAAVEIVGRLLPFHFHFTFSWNFALYIILNILPQIILFVFLLRKPKNVRPWAWVAALLPFLPLLRMLLLSGKTWQSYLLYHGATLCYDISLALLYYFGYTSTDTTQQTGAVKKVMASLYTNIGGKIKTLAQIVCCLGIIGSVVYGIYFYNAYYSVRGVGLVIIFGGSLFSWVSLFFVYGFGELIEKTTVIAEAVSKKDDSKDAAETAPKADAEKETVE